MVYANFDFYTGNGGTILTAETVDQALKKSSDAIDVLTYNRIYTIGLPNLTPFQQETVKRVCCDLADFQMENADLLESALSSYTINGVSVAFTGTPTIATENGVMIPSELLRRLRATGLCWGAIR
ncbi:MAG: hypothetical protein PHX61_10890 [Alphaproteobacteria bacterium]|nr:hypothetical protein [Alphaproteobacteria bacterium]